MTLLSAFGLVCRELDAGDLCARSSQQLVTSWPLRLHARWDRFTDSFRVHGRSAWLKESGRELQFGGGG